MSKEFVSLSSCNHVPMKICPYCAEEIQDAAIVCKHCKKELPRVTSKKKSNFSPNQIFIIIAIGIIAVIFILIKIGGCDKTKNENPSPVKNTKLQTSLKYLNDIPEISWIEFDDNNVYIGFNPRPDDLDLIIKAAAINGNKATNFGVHVWAIDATKYPKGWRPGMGSYFKEVTARYGKIEK